MFPNFVSSCILLHKLFPRFFLGLKTQKYVLLIIRLIKKNYFIKFKHEVDDDDVGFQSGPMKGAILRNNQFEKKISDKNENKVKDFRD